MLENFVIYAYIRQHTVYNYVLVVSKLDKNHLP